MVSGVKTLHKTLLILGVALLGIIWLIEPSSASVANNQPCLSCHGDNQFKAKYLGDSINNPIVFVDSVVFRASSHGTYSCKVCHKGADEKLMPVKGLSSAAIKRDANASCEGCHAQAAKALGNSAHGIAAAKKGKEVFCSDCHGLHNISKKEDAASAVSRGSVTTTCSQCHNGREKSSYLASFHGMASGSGSLQTATCVNCHGSHDILGPRDRNSAVAPANVSQTCAKCHGAVSPNFGKGAEHFELKPTGPGAPVYWISKVFSWLIVIVLSFMVLHIELELVNYVWYNLTLRHKKR